MRDIALAALAPRDFGECNIVLFEDSESGTELFPLSVLRPSWDIFWGMGSLRALVLARIAPQYGVRYAPRGDLQALVSRQAGTELEGWDEGADVLFVSGRLLACTAASSGSVLPRTVVDETGRPVLARRPAVAAKPLLLLSGTELTDALVQDEAGAVVSAQAGWNIFCVRYVWDYMRQNRSLLNLLLTAGGRGVREWGGAMALRELPAGVQSTDKVGGHAIFAGHGVKLMPGVVFGNHAGPVWIGAGTEIEPHCYLEGPLYVGANCRVKAGTRLYHGCSLGAVCRVSGELSESIFQGYVNKQHDGFVGNSHLGSWVNLGADTVTSNLRNDYGSNKVQVGKRRIDSGERFLGLMCGDHTKTGINTMFNTATVVGIGANVYGADYPPKYIESFMWGGAAGLKAGDLQGTLSTARFAMSRREVELSSEEAELIAQHYAARVTNRKEMS